MQLHTTAHITRLDVRISNLRGGLHILFDIRHRSSQSIPPSRPIPGKGSEGADSRPDPHARNAPAARQTLVFSRVWDSWCYGYRFDLLLWLMGRPFWRSEMSYLDPPR